MATNYGAQIFNNAISSLASQQAVIANISSNIANVNTEGYARRSLQLQTRVTNGRAAGFTVGNGVEVGEINRINDQFLRALVRDGHADSESYGIQQEFLERVESLFSLSGDKETIGTTLTGFFAAVDDLSLNPASIELRAEFIERAKDLTNAISQTFKSIAELQDECDRRIATEIESVNSLTEQIAGLNSIIASREGTGSVAADERDKRDMLIERLSEKISFDMVETSDGSVTISLSSGFPLVSGPNHRDIELTKTPSFAGATMPQSLSGGVLNHIVYDYDQSGASPAHIDLTKVLQEGGGSIGGLLQVRGYNDVSNTGPFTADGPLVEVAERVEAITQQLLTTVNQTYLGADEDSGTVGWQPSSADLDGNPPSTYGLFSFAFSGNPDANADGLPNDLSYANHGVYNYSSILDVAFTDPRRVAAALDTDAVEGSTAFAEGDNRNLIALSNLNTTDMTFNIGSGFNLTSTLSDAYNETVGKVGNLKIRADINAAVATDNLDTAQNRLDEITGVSLDEEFTGLIKFQKAYEANAKLIQIATNLMDQIMSML